MTWVLYPWLSCLSPSVEFQKSIIHFPVFTYCLSFFSPFFFFLGLTPDLLRCSLPSSPSLSLSLRPVFPHSPLWNKVLEGEGVNPSRVSKQKTKSDKKTEKSRDHSKPKQNMADTCKSANRASALTKGQSRIALFFSNISNNSIGGCCRLGRLSSSFPLSALLPSYDRALIPRPTGPHLFYKRPVTATFFLLIFTSYISSSHTNTHITHPH